MTAIAVARPIVRAAPASGAWRLALMVAVSTALALLLTRPLLSLVMAGGFGDPDDAMRLAEVRAWMAGQPWFDVTAMRLDPPHGASMHWSRLVDVPNAALIRLFGCFVDQTTAEGLDRIVLPSLWLIGLFFGMARLATVLLGRKAQGAALLGILASGATLVQFQPGRIGHHAPETLLLVLAVGAALSSLDPVRARQAGLAGVLVALAMAISLETLPLLAALCLVMVLAWVWRGSALSPSLAWFGAGLGLALPLLFAATVAPDHWLMPVADALGRGHVLGGMIGAAGAVAASFATPRLPSVIARLGIAVLIGVCVVAALVGLAPEALHSPFAAVDPLVRSVWLDHVAESKSLPSFMRGQPMLGLAVAGPVVLGTALVLVAARTSRGVAGLRFAALGVLCLAGLALGLWQLRGFASVTPLALCGGVFAVERVRARLEMRGMTLVAAAAPLAILPFTSTAWALALPTDSARPASHACLAPSALAPLATLPAGSAVAPLEAGAQLIEGTSLDPFAAPYHRNNDGNRFAMDVWRAVPDVARKMLDDRRVTYVVVCSGEGDISRLAAMAPGGLAARLLSDRVPAFLVRVPIAGTPYEVFRMSSDR